MPAALELARTGRLKTHPTALALLSAHAVGLLDNDPPADGPPNDSRSDGGATP